MAVTKNNRHNSDIAATPLFWRPKWLRFAMSPRRRNATSPRSHNGDVPATSLLRYRLKVATAMSPQYCHGDVAAMSQSASEFSQKSPRRCCRDIAQVTRMRLESPRQCCHAIAAILPLLTCMYWKALAMQVCALSHALSDDVGFGWRPNDRLTTIQQFSCIS